MILGNEALAYAIDPTTIGLATFTDLGSLISAFMPVVMAISGLLLFAYLLMGGLKYLSSGGDDKAIGEARKIITNAVIGLLIVFTAFFAVRILETVLGLQITGL